MHSFSTRPARRRVVAALATVAVVTVGLLPGPALAHTADLPTRMQAALGGSGTRGYVLKRVYTSASQDVLGSQNANFVFEPASSIKFLHALHAERQIQSGAATTTQTVAVPIGADNSCPVESPTSSATLEFAIERMMENSSNPHTEAIKDEFGQAAINQTAWNLGAVSSQLQHRLGCGGPPPNKLTLNDITLLYDRAFTDDTVLSPVRRQHLWSRMPSYMSQLWNSAKDEAQVHYGADAPAAFYANLKVAFKGGSYTYCTGNDCTTPAYRSVAGYVEIPAKQWVLSQGMLVKTIVPRRYVFGVFIDDATTQPGDLFSASYLADKALSDSLGVLFRDELKSALATWF